MTWSGTPVLVTGGGGFIGSHLVEMLSAAGASVRAMIRYTSRNDEGNLRHVAPEHRANIEIVAGDLRDPDAVRAAAEGAAYVFHLGALIAIPYSYVHPREVVETNVLGTLNVLEAARVTLPQRVVHISTSEVYGTARRVPIDETHPLQGQSPYSASKIGADRIAESYHRSFGVPVVTVRPFNTYGPRQSARAVIPTIVMQLLAGDRIRLGATHPTRDFTYVTDTARGMMLAAVADDVDGLEVNLGSGKEISIGELATRLMDVVGRRVPVEQETVRLRPEASEVERLIADTTVAHTRLGWAAEVPLEEGLQHVVEWVRQHLDSYTTDRYVV
jgi:dTDP-glucose 4,6-dehydratase